MNSITECLERINSLTQQNYEILKTINESFFTKREHLVVNVENNQYIIPSFVALENKVNALQEGLNNLVNAPLSGEAYFNYDGNSKTIEIRGFNNTPNAVKLDTSNADKFFVEENSVFKDFVTPNAFLKFDLTTLPDDISSVIVKKITPLTSSAKELLQSYLQTVNDEEEVISISKASVAYKDLYKQLSILIKGVDYEEYDTIRQLPIRQSIGTGTYVITKVIEDKILNDLTEQLTLEISTKTPLVYKKFDETIDVDLEPGQFITTYNNRVKLQIVDVNVQSHQLVLNVVNGDYLDLIGYEGEVDPNDLDKIQEMSKLRFFSDSDYSKDKYIGVTLEEDQYIGIFVAPLNSRMNVQAPWGQGVILDTFVIKNDAGESYEVYYENNVKNIGDILKEIVTLTNNSIMKYNKEEFDEFTGYVPTINPDNLSVIQINRHLNNSPTIVKIRSLYSQKKQYEINLNEIEGKITNTNTTLASVSFDDTSGLRTIYESQLDEYTKKKNEIVSAINSVINEISLAVNNSEVPIENAKYHIRGYFDWDSALSTLDETLTKYRDHVKGIKVEYRYKNKDQTTGTAESFQNGRFIYSDWNLMEGFDRKVKPSRSIDKYTFEYEPNNDRANEPSFNQIDIPITQGESVDIRLKIVWDFGYPYIETTSAWSEVLNVPFPDEYLKDVQVLTIVEENNSDIETNRFKNILIDNGVTVHIDDRQIDQDLTYFHKPEHIASGFYTDERRVIPLKDKLSTMDSAIINLEDTVFGTSSENIKIEFIFNSTSTQIFPDQDNIVSIDVESPSGDVPVTDITSNKYVYAANLKLTNTSKHSIRLFSLFPGNRNVNISSQASKYDADDYAKDILINSNIFGAGSATTEDTQQFSYHNQIRNQFLYIRSKDTYTGSDLENSVNLLENIYPAATAMINSNLSQICINSDTSRTYRIIESGESIVIPIVINMYSSIVRSGSSYIGTPLNSIDLSFDLRTSLYEDPTNYMIKIKRITDNSNSLYQKIVQAQINTTKYNSVIANVY